MSAPSRMNARDSAIFCHWPPDSSRPSLNHLPSCVSYPAGSSSMNGAAMPSSRGLAPARLVLEVRDVAGADVLADLELVAREVLEDDADAPAQRAGLPVVEVEPVEQDAALVGPVQARQQLDQRRLAGAVLADQRQALARPQCEADVAHGRLRWRPGR